jgi:hypothetical protein
VTELRASTLYQSVGGVQTLIRLVGSPLRRAMLQPGASTLEIIRFINQLQGNVESFIRRQRTALLEPGNLIQGITFTANQQQSVSHRLGHGYRGYLVTRAVTAAWSGFSTPQAGALDTVTALITSGNAGTYDFYFF